MEDAQLSSRIFFQEPKWLKWKESNQMKNVDHSLASIKIPNVWVPIMKDKNSD